jgi:hypothetical protein
LIKNLFLNLLKFLQNLGKFGKKNCDKIYLSVLLRPKIWNSAPHFHPNKSLDGTQWVIALLFVHLFCVVLVQHDQSPIYLWRKVVFLELWDPPNADASDCVLGVFGKLSPRRGAWTWFYAVWTCLRCKSSWMLNDFFTEKLN